jgi:integrase
MRNNAGAAEAQNSGGRVVIRLPRNWCGGKAKRFALGLPATAENLAYGAQLASRINSDYALGQFDATLARYKPQPKAEADAAYILGAYELWERYCDYKSPKWKAKTRHYYQVTLARHIAKMPQDWANPLAIRSWLLANTSEGVATRCLNSLQTVINWAIRCRLVAAQANPFDRMGRDLGSAQKAAPANALSQIETAAVIAAFANHPLHSAYTPFVEFLFLSGCRPSEAVGLRWQQVAKDCRSVEFNRSIVRVDGQAIENRLSKNNRSRIFPCSEPLTALLLSLDRPTNQNSLVFGRAGQPLNYEAFAKRPWPSVVYPVLGRKSTPYSARDTFITDQIAKGKPPALVAKWVDNSIAMIEAKYLDVSAIHTIRPD